MRPRTPLLRVPCNEETWLTFSLYLKRLSTDMDYGKGGQFERSLFNLVNSPGPGF